MSVRIAIATCPRYPALPPDERLLVRALAERGVEAVPATWHDPAVRWEAFAAVIIRSTWDYHERHAEFLGWIGRLESLGVPTWNPPPLLRWNSEKTYLADLSAAGIPVTPTRFATGDASLEAMLGAERWSEAVVKPAISATAHETFRVRQGDAAVFGATWRRLLARGTVLVQPLVREIVEHGEWSLCFPGGAFTHAVLKRAKPGDFRVQEEWGGSTERRDPPAGAVEAAARALRCAPGEWLYARVDGCMVDGQFQVTELEMLEPTLYLDKEPGAPGRFADAIAAKVTGGDET